jgi:hypothetical protein
MSKSLCKESGQQQAKPTGTLKAKAPAMCGGAQPRTQKHRTMNFAA